MLRMADDDWDPDLDFPGLDSSAVITDVGVDQFVLCHQVRALRSLLTGVHMFKKQMCTGIKFVLWRTFISICVSCYDSFTDLVDAHQAKVQPMLHVTIALHKGLNGPLTGTGAMEAPGAGASMTLEVDFQTPGQEGTHHMSMPIGELSFSIGFRIWRRRSDLLLCWFSRLFS